jgi:hypothetical protein
VRRVAAILALAAVAVPAPAEARRVTGRWLLELATLLHHSCGGRKITRLARGSQVARSEENLDRWTRRFEVPAIIAAFLVIPAIAIEASVGLAELGILLSALRDR